ncbi:MAG: MOSC domain-containing protein [Oscillospiraceae bacterium]|jgi:MOSC domain-containing protein YiiM|nr:MOSC domain-containing protein [Oscillospiraceae bacterium]
MGTDIDYAAAVIAISGKTSRGERIDTGGHALAARLTNADRSEYLLTGKVIAVCVSEKKGEQKIPRDYITLVPEHGVESDAHAGKWHRQVSLLAKSSVDSLQAKVDISLTPGVFAENILVDGLDLKTLPIGTQLEIADALLEVTQIGKECHSDCVIRQKAGDCVMPREGIFARVLIGGVVRSGDAVEVVG